jgi:hypothetical protein
MPNYKLNQFMTKFKKGLKFILILIFMLSFFYLINYCSDKSFNKKMNELKLNGKIVSKYIDKQDHNIPKILIIDKQESITLDLTNESSGLFEFIQEGDSIIKTNNNRKVHVFNSSKDSIFEMTF